MMRVLRASIALVLSALVLTPSLAGATVETQVHHGSDCVRESGGTYATSIYGTHNTSTTQAMTLRCPTAGSYYGTGAKINAWVYDRHPTQDVCCTMYAQSFGGTVYSQQTLCTSNSSPDPTRLSFTSVTQWAMVHMSCSLPPAYNGNFSHVTSYFTSE